MAGGNTCMYSTVQLGSVCVCVSVYVCVHVWIQACECVCVCWSVYMYFHHLCVLHGAPGGSGALMCEHQ